MKFNGVKFKPCDECGQDPMVWTEKKDFDSWCDWSAIAQCSCGWCARGYGSTKIRAIEDAAAGWNVGYLYPVRD